MTEQQAVEEALEFHDSNQSVFVLDSDGDLWEMNKAEQGNGNDTAYGEGAEQRKKEEA